MKLKDIQNKSLEGWQVKPVHTMELKHSLMGYFPLLADGKTVVCVNKEDLEKIWNTLPKKDVKTEEVNCMVNLQEKLVVPLVDNGASSDDFLLITDDIEERLKDTVFEYARGLLSLVDESHCEFPK